MIHLPTIMAADTQNYFYHIFPTTIARSQFFYSIGLYLQRVFFAKFEAGIHFEILPCSKGVF